jgi:hypothetical protein
MDIIDFYIVKHYGTALKQQSSKTVVHTLTKTSLQWLGELKWSAKSYVGFAATD